jgi:cation diffusion facilitator family transporter
MTDIRKAIGIGILTVCVNIVLMAVKIVAGLIGNSYALIADGIESAGDIFSSLIRWAGFQLSLRPADENHPYGHRKIESLAGVFSGVRSLSPPQSSHGILFLKFALRIMPLSGLRYPS